MAIRGKKIRLSTRERKKMRIRKRVAGNADRMRLSVFRSSKHTYAQVVSDQSGAVLVSASTLQPDVMAELEKLKTTSGGESRAGSEGEAASGSSNKGAGNSSAKSVLAARAVGIVLARRGKASNISRVVFDRNGYLYHGRVKAVADGAREGGFEF